jgi:hypothetical protein
MLCNTCMSVSVCVCVCTLHVLTRVATFLAKFVKLVLKGSVTCTYVRVAFWSPMLSWLWPGQSKACLYVCQGMDAASMRATQACMFRAGQMLLKHTKKNSFCFETTICHTFCLFAACGDAAHAPIQALLFEHGAHRLLQKNHL